MHAKIGLDFNKRPHFYNGFKNLTLIKSQIKLTLSQKFFYKNTAFTINLIAQLHIYKFATRPHVVLY